MENKGRTLDEDKVRHIIVDSILAEFKTKKVPLGIGIPALMELVTCSCAAVMNKIEFEECLGQMRNLFSYMKEEDEKT